MFVFNMQIFKCRFLHIWLVCAHLCVHNSQKQNLLHWAGDSQKLVASFRSLVSWVLFSVLWSANLSGAYLLSSNLRFTEIPCHKELMVRVAKQETRCSLLSFGTNTPPTHTHTDTRTVRGFYDY